MHRQLPFLQKRYAYKLKIKQLSTKKIKVALKKNKRKKTYFANWKKKKQTEERTPKVKETSTSATLSIHIPIEETLLFL